MHSSWDLWVWVWVRNEVNVFWAAVDAGSLEMRTVASEMQRAAGDHNSRACAADWTNGEFIDAPCV